MKALHKSFTQQEPIPEDAIARAVEVLRSGRLHRYNLAAGEVGEVALLEQEFAAYIEQPYCLACASGGYALHIALRAIGLQSQEPVLTNAFTLSPVPGAIHNAGGQPLLIETTLDYTIDIDDLVRATEQSGAKVLLLSHMRGHIADMTAIMQHCAQYRLVLIEDCAHTMGASWQGQPSGTFGQIACFSTQTYKHINSGEGGLLTTADPELMRKAVILSGSYMLYGTHIAAPEAESFKQTRLETPNYSGRMDHLRAAILRPQLRTLDDNAKRWNERYAVLEQALRARPEIYIPTRSKHEAYVGSSIQFSLPEFDAADIAQFIAECEQRGVMIKWFGAPEPSGYTSRYDSWQYLDKPPDLPQTQRVLATLCDMRIPLTFSIADCELIGAIIADVLD